MEDKVQHIPFKTTCPACGKDCRAFFLAEDVEKIKLRSLECEWCGHNTVNGPPKKQLVMWKRM